MNGKFALKMRARSGQEMSASKLLHRQSSRQSPFVSMGADIANGMKTFLKKQSDGTMAFDSKKVVEEPNFVALQIVVKGWNIQLGIGINPSTDLALKNKY